FSCRNQAEMAHTCRGSISLHGALIYTVDACTFVISNGGTQTFHIKASTEVERQSWVTALELAKAKAIRTMESEEDDEEADESGGHDDWPGIARKLEIQLNELQTCGDVLAKHWRNLAKPLSEMEANADPEALQGKTKEVCERATLFRIASNAMINACAEYLETAQNHGHKLVRALQHEKEQRARLQDMVETLAQQHSKLEQAANAHTHRPAINASENEEEDDNEFYDALAEGGGTPNQHGDDLFTLNIRTGHRRNSSDSSSETEETRETKQVVVVTGKHTNIPRTETERKAGTSQNLSGSNASKRQRRVRVPDKPNYPLNLWSIMKNCIGKDLSKIPMPVNFSEPLSMLQRLTEDYEYADILDAAAKCTDPCEQLAYVAAFTISSYSTTSTRTGNRSTRCWVIPLGIAHVEFNSSGNKYSWRKVTTTVHNIIVGKLWVDQHGDMEITGKGPANGIKCHLKYIPYSYFTRDSQRRVKGVVMDGTGSVKWIINGTWDDQVEISAVTGNTGTASNPVYQTGPSVLAWKCRPPPEDSDKFYNFTLLAAQLNEPEEGVAPTDSRLRPDQRLMEEGNWDDANKEKVRLEEKQRAVRRQREAEAERAAAEGRPYQPYKPVWFEQTKEDDSDVIHHVYKGTYWDAKDKQEWSECPDIF
ncbi:hypothetical protein NQ314_007258, partial [Rhamnusium bicolor]